MKLVIEVDDPEVVAALETLLKTAPHLEPKTAPRLDDKKTSEAKKHPELLAIQAAEEELAALPTLLDEAREAVRAVRKRPFAHSPEQAQKLREVGERQGKYAFQCLLDELAHQHRDAKEADIKAAKEKVRRLAEKKKAVNKILSDLRRRVRSRETAEAREARAKDARSARRTATDAVLREVFLAGINALSSKGGKR